MNIIKGQKQDISNIMDIISKCINNMKTQNIFQWDEAYPNLNIIEKDILHEEGYVLQDNEKAIAYVAINEEQSEEYSEIFWNTNGQKVLVIHRLAVNPELQGMGIAKKLLKFIEEFGCANKYTCIRLDAYSGNEKALKLYEGFGYKKVGQIYFPRRKLSFYCYEKDI